MQLCEVQHAKLPCPSLSLGVFSNLCPLIWWCHPTMSSSVVPFSSCPQYFPASESFPKSQLFVSGGQNIGASASVSILPMNSQSWIPLGLSGLISLLFKGLSGVVSSTTTQNNQNSSVLSLLYGPPLTFEHDYWKNHNFDHTDLCWQSDLSDVSDGLDLYIPDDQWCWTPFCILFYVFFGKVSI